MTKKLVLMSFLLAAATAQAETIDSSYSYNSAAVKAGTANKVCMKEAFIKRSSGTLVTGLGTANLKPYSVTEEKWNTTTNSYVSKAVTVTYSMTAITPAGVYSICFTPSGFTWQAGASYQADAIVKGTTASDNGLFHTTWTTN